MNTTFLFSFLLILWININFVDSQNNVNLTVKLLSTYVFPDETDFNASGCESFEYDFDNNLWYFVDWGDEGEIGSISGDFPIDSNNSNIKYNIMTSSIGSTGSTGMVYYDGYLYIANGRTGNLTQINIETKLITNTVYVWDALNGLCNV